MDKYLFAIFLLMFSFYLSGQSINITYEFDNTYNYCNNKKLGIPEAPHITEHYTLVICSSVSRLTLDSMKIISGEGFEGSLYTPKYTYFKDYNSKKLHKLFKVGSNFKGESEDLDYSAEEPWEIDRSQTKEILGLKCILAIRRENRPPNCIEHVWYTEELPFSDAPDLNHIGLPGIVLEYYTTNHDSYSYEAIDISVKDECSFENIPQYSSMKMDNSNISSLMRSGTKEFPYFILDENTKKGTWILAK